jgi:hypothetical protein
VETARNFVENLCAGERTRYMMRMFGLGFFVMLTVTWLVQLLDALRYKPEGRGIDSI